MPCVNEVCTDTKNCPIVYECGKTRVFEDLMVHALLTHGQLCHTCNTQTATRGQSAHSTDPCLHSVTT